MRRNLTLNPVKPHWLFGKDYRETNCSFSKPTPEREYIRILAHCTPCPRTVKSIYPNTKYPMQEMLRDMVREGLLERYTDGRRNYFLTTNKGFELFKLGCRR